MKTCRYRLEIVGTQAVCGSPYTNNAPARMPLDFCDICPVADTPAPIEINASGKVLGLKRTRPCLRRGKVIWRPSLCQGTWVYQCELFGQCSLAGGVSGLAGCEHCPSYEEE